MSDLYIRQRPLKLHTPSKVVVVGVGGTGTWTALFLAMSGVKELHIMDPDVLEVSNLNRLPFTTEDVDEKKTDVVRKLIESLRPDARVFAYDEADEFSLTMIEGSFLFDCTDSHKTQLMLSKWCRPRGIKYIRVGYDGTHITVTNSIPEWNVGEADDGGYTVQPSWVVPAALAACFGVAKAMANHGIEVSEDLRTTKGFLEYEAVAERR